MRKFSSFLSFVGVLLIISGIILNYQLDLSNNFQESKTSIQIEAQNKYYRDYNFIFTKNTENTNPNNYQELLDLMYSIINDGYDKFTFYCGDSYDSCIDDITKLANDQETLSTINNYVHSYNSFENMKITYTDQGKVTVQFSKYYSDEDIELINNKVDSIYNQYYIPNDTDRNNILRLHDYIINTTKYDTARAYYDILDYKSNIAYGTLLEGHAVCGGYADAMQIFLDKMNIKNFKVANSDHVWNAVYLDNAWYNLDLTWDDPIVSDGSDLLEYNYFLISTEKLQQLDITQHSIKFENYQELKNS